MLIFIKEDIMKTNPLYNYLVKNIIHRATNWRQKENFCFYPLAIQGNLGYFESESKLNVIEHHISVYSEIDDNLGFSSLYHYTAILSNDTKLHIYFDTNDNRFEVTLTTPTNQIRRITHLLEEENSQILDFCFLVETQVQGIIQPLRAEQDILIDTLKTTYISRLSGITKSLFEQDQTMVSIESLIQGTIELGEELLTICYKKKFFKATLRFLKQSLTCLEEYQETVLEQQAMPIAITMDSEIVVSHPVTSSSILFESVHGHPTQAKSSNKKIIQQKFQCLIEKFEPAKQSYLSKLHDFESEQDLSSKLRLFSNFVEHDLPELNGLHLCLDQIFENLSKTQQIRLSQVSLELALLTQNHEKKGVDLIFKCFEQEDEHLLEICEKTFKTFIMMLSREQIAQIVLKQNLSALQYLLKIAEFNLNHYVIHMGPDQLLSPLCLAFELQNLDMFKMFLKNKASCLSLYKDLPLAHALLELDSTHPFQLAFYEYSLDMMDKNKINLYKTLASSVLRKSKDTLDVTLKSYLKDTFRKYCDTFRGLNSLTVGKSTMAVSDFFHASAIPEMGRLTWAEKGPLRELQQKLDELTAFTSKIKRTDLRQIIDLHKREAQKIIGSGTDKSLNKDEIILKAKKETECCAKALRLLQLTMKQRPTQNEKKELKAIDLFFSGGENTRGGHIKHKSDNLALIEQKLVEIRKVATQYRELVSLRGEILNSEIELIYEDLSKPHCWQDQNITEALSVLDDVFQFFYKRLKIEMEARERVFSQKFYHVLPSCFENFLKNMFFQCQDMPKDTTCTLPYGPGTIISFH